MNAPDARSRLLPAAAVTGLAALAFSLACRLTTDPAFAYHASTPLIGRLLGESRRALAGDLYEEADRYFHRGVGHVRERAPMGFIQRLADEVRPRTVHAHLSEYDIGEMMPWLRFTTRADPHNVDAYLDAAFWVDAGHDGRRGLAMGILEEARRNNPADYRIPMERGRLLLLGGGDVRGAARAFDAALRMWETAPGVDDARKQIDRAALLDFRGFTHELEGDRAAALDCYRESVRARPGFEGPRALIVEIEAGRRTRGDAERQLAALMKRKVTPDDVCHRDGEHEHAHGRVPGAPAH